ncbi:MAG: hypothetical protein A2Z12_01310 [Actinobacteria bacterium RBG_16_68_21]|nr:MAG: hypothetical protein A2Z12_01310 [Actinobacteria bacterium RBG_16_68_21]
MTQPDRAPGGRRLRPAGHALVTMLIALGLALFLNSDALLKTAERQPLGSTMRGLTVGIMDPIAAVGDALLLDRPRAFLDDLLGKADGGGAVAATTTTSTTATTMAGATTTTTSSTVPVTRLYTEDDPLKLWIVGDSFVEFVAPVLRSDLAETGVVDTETDFRFSSGLIRRDVFDWPAHVTGRLPEVMPDVVIAQFGGNDGQEVNVNGVLVAPEDQAWQDLYLGRVLELADVLLGSGVERVYWLGLPIMRNQAFDARVRIMNSVYAEAAASRDGVTFIDVHSLFQDSSGEFSTYLEDASGRLVAVRTPDGAHYTLEGATLLANHLAEMLTVDLGLPTG